MEEESELRECAEDDNGLWRFRTRDNLAMAVSTKRDTVQCWGLHLRLSLHHARHGGNHPIEHHFQRKKWSLLFGPCRSRSQRHRSKHLYKSPAALLIIDQILKLALRPARPSSVFRYCCTSRARFCSTRPRSNTGRSELRTILKLRPARSSSKASVIAKHTPSHFDSPPNSAIRHLTL